MKKDLSTKMLMEYPDVFADAENVCLFHGRQVIIPDNLEPLPQEIHYKEEDGTIKERRVDIRMRLRDNGIELAILHLENQSDVSNIMPLRDMGYTYSSYQEQIRDIKRKNKEEGLYYITKEIGPDQRLHPVVSLVLYYGSVEWTAPTHLKEMLEIPQDEYGDWESLIEDHKIHLVDLSHQSDEEVDQYRSDLWYVAKSLGGGKDREKYHRFLEEEKKRKMQHPEAVIDMITAFAGRAEARRMAKKAITEMKEKGGRCTMYTILDYLEEEGLQKGLQKGLEQGREKGMKQGLEEGMERGLKQGIEQGMERGMEQGVKQGIEQGIEQGRDQLLYRMFQNNKTPEDISKFVGEPLEYIYDAHQRYQIMVKENGGYGE